MAKVHTTISIEEDILKRAKQTGMNVSAEIEKALRNRIIPTKSEMPINDLFIRCSLCRNEIDEGFFCREGKKVFCTECHKTWDMVRHCRAFFDSEGQHEHLKFPSDKRLDLPKAIIETVNTQEKQEDWK